MITTILQILYNDSFIFILHSRKMKDFLDERKEAQMGGKKPYNRKRIPSQIKKVK